MGGKKQKTEEALRPSISIMLRCVGRSHLQGSLARSSRSSHDVVLRHSMVRGSCLQTTMHGAFLQPASAIQINQNKIGYRTASSSSTKGHGLDVAMLSPFQKARHWGGIYSELSKVRLSALVVMTTGAGYVFSGAASSAGFLPFAAAAVGTTLAACSANTFNQVHYFYKCMQSVMLSFTGVGGEKRPSHEAYC